MLSQSTPTETEQVFQKLIKDLTETTKLLSIKDYPEVSLDQLNHYLHKQPLNNPHFGLLLHFTIEDDRLIPALMAVHKREVVAGEIAGLLFEWIKYHPLIGGRMTTAQGAFILGPNRDIRMPDVAYTPREIERNLAYEQGWTYYGEPFAASFVVEIDNLSSRSKFNELDTKMRDYFAHGVQLGWQIDPWQKKMYEYIRDRNGTCRRIGGSSWRNLTGRSVLPEFVVESYELEIAVNAEEGSSSEDETEVLNCPYSNCGFTCTSPSQFTAHVDWHRKELIKRRYYESQ
jgi:Putative restriction endonuclease